MNPFERTARRRQLLRGRLPMAVCLLTIAGLLTAHRAFADQASGNVCMGTLFTAATGQKLNCTSQDVKIARATSVSPSTCENGTSFTLSATFEVDLSGGGTKQTRYDLGLYFDTLGDPDHDGARGGTCSLSVIEDGDTGYLQLDPSPPDICGDINTANNPLFPTITIPNVLCTGDGSTDCDGGQCLLLPNCTSWRQPGANEVCDAATDAFPGTSSKCNCDDTFSVPVTVTPASATMHKTPTKAIVTYSLTAANTNPSHTANLNALCDDTYGTVAGTCNFNSTTGTCPLSVADAGNVKSTTCVLPHLLAKQGDAGDSYTCTFDVEVDSPGSPNQVTDTVTGTVVDTVNTTSTCPAGVASVIVDLPASP